MPIGSVNIWINEFHYDNASTDTGEFIEIAGIAGFDLTGWSIALYNGFNGLLYNTLALSGALADTTGTGFGILSVPAVGLQNGAPDGFALVDNTGAVIEFLSYEGAFVAVDGPAAGISSDDVLVDEDPAPAAGTSIARIGTGDDPTDFTWVLDTDDTPGSVNNGQALTPSAGQSFSIAAANADQPEGSTGTTAFTFIVARANPSADATLEWSVTGLGGSGQADAGDFSGPTAGTVTFTGSETEQTITIDVVGDTATEPSETFSVTLANPSSGTINVATATGTIQNDDVTLTPISTIQGSGQASPLVGQIVTTTGVVIAVDTNGSRGFYIQDATGDGNAATSDGLFVFRPSGALPTVGHMVQVTGTVLEFTPSGAAVGSLSTTELSSVSSIVDLGVPALPVAPTLIGGPGGLLPPTESLIDGIAFYESLEGMLVIVTDAVAVGPTTGFGEIFTIVDDGDPLNGSSATGLTDRGNLLLTGGDSAFGDTNTTGGDFNPERIQIDDDSGILAGFASPKVDVGARLGDVTGIVNYDFGNYQVVATQAYSVTAQSTLVKEVGALTSDADHLLVASYNAENLDPGDGVARFTTIADQILNSLNAPDIVALQEIQDSDGPTNSATTSADMTLQMLVDSINLQADDGIEYAFIDNPFIGDDTNGGEPGGNIRTAFLYRSDRVALVADSLRTIAADGSVIGDPSGNTDQQVNPDNPFFTSRPPLVAIFSFNGEDVTIVNNHFTSKGGSAPLLGADQPPFDAGEVQRAAQAQAVNSFVDLLLASDPDAHVVVAGDLNEFPAEEPMNVLRGTAMIANYDVPGTDPFFATADYLPGGDSILSDLLELLPADEQYDYVFEGNSETLDHLLATDLLAAIAEFDVVHINAEFADQTSDHDPLVARFAILHNDAPVLTSDPSFSIAENTTIVGTVTASDPEGDDFTFALAGGDDAGFFAIDADTGELVFVALPDFETPEDTNGDNAYEVVVAATDETGLSSTQAISVIVTDVVEAGQIISGGNGHQSLVGTTGPDTMNGGNGDDSVDGNDGDDTINGGNGDDILVGGRGNDVMRGGNGIDWIHGGIGNDSIDGGNGADALNGGTGDDVLTGGNGNDLFVFDAGFGVDLITDFRDFDQIVLDHDIFADSQSVLAASQQVGASTVITVDADNTITLNNVQLAGLDAGDFLLV